MRALRSDVTDERVLAAMARVPRERFVPPEAADYAYADKPLAIGYGQTISQPHIVAYTLQAARLTGSERVLDIGTGSGYQAALLAELAREVISVELIPELAQRAETALREAGYDKIEVHVAGDELGWPAGAPYDVIVVAAAAPRVPQSLVDQLAPNGRLVIPAGGRDQQDLLLVEKRPEGVTVTRLLGCRFVPLIGAEAYSESNSSEFKSS